MNCRNIQSKFPDYLTGDLKPQIVESVKEHIASCTTCRLELEELTTIWTKLGVLSDEQPSPNLRKNFYTMLESFQEGVNKEGTALPSKKHKNRFFKNFGIKKLYEWIWPQHPVYQFVFTLAFLIMGFLIGSYTQSQGPRSSELELLRNQNQEMNQELTLSLLNQSSPSMRLKGVNWSSQLQQPDEKILEALIYTLNHDSNINVRLSVIDSLYLFSDYPQVKQGIIQSLPQQSSPMVQTALIDLLIDLREKKAAQSLSQLIKNNNLDPDVKKRAQSGLEKLL
jgi:hypothetical protein